MLKVVVYLVLSLKIFTITSEEYWEALNKKADKLFSGLDIGFDISGGISTDNDEKEAIGEIKFTVPLYSSKEQLSKKIEKQEFLEKGARLIKEMKVNERFLEFLKNQEKIKQATMYEDGARGSDEYFGIVKEIIDTEEEIKEIERILESLVK